MPVNFLSHLNENLAHLRFIVPEVIVAATFLLALIVDFILPPERRKTTGYLSILGLLAAMWFNAQQNQDFLLHQGSVQLKLYSGMIVHDHFATFFKFIILLGTVISLLLSINARELAGKNHGEFYLLLLAVCLGGMFLASATNLLMIYLSLESLSVVSYAMAGYLKRDRKSAEAGMKYVIYGAMASGIMIFGMSYLYGLGGTLNLLSDTRTGAPGLAELVIGFETAHGPVARAGMAAVLVMVFSGFLYKIAAVPFHYWSPDVYEGAPTTATGFFSVVPKAAGFAVLIRVICEFFPLGETTGNWLEYPNVERIIGVLAVLTMLVGNLAALGQTNAKRMLAYSSIAHAGYMLAGLSVLDNSGGPAAVLFYMVIYLFMNLGAFTVLVALENVMGGCELRQLRGAVQREPVLVVALCIFLFSLTGFPPLAGFTGKYLIMVELAGSGHYGLVAFIGFNSVVSLWYYMKLAKAVAIDEPEDQPLPAASTPLSYNLLAVFKSAALIGLFCYFEPLHRLCQTVVGSLSNR